MPSTRSQTARNTRSSGPASIHTGIGTSTGVKRRQAKAKSKTSGIPAKPSAPRNHPDNKEKIRHILWNLVEKYLPWLKIILEPFKSSNETVVFIIIVAILMCYGFWSFRITFINAVSVFWQKRFTADLPSVYFNEVSWPPRHRWMWREEEILNVTTRIKAMSKEHDGKQIHMYLIGGPGSGKSELARQIGVRLYESLKQDKQPVDVITIDASSETSIMSSLVDSVFALCNGSAQKADGIRQIKEELNLRFGNLFPSEGNVLKTEMKLKVLYAKLGELFKQRNSRPVLIFDNVRDLKSLFSYLNLEPGSKYFTSFVVIVTLQKRVSALERVSRYVQVQDLYEGMSIADSVELLKLISGLNKDSEHQAAEKLATILGKQPLALATAAIYIDSVREGPPKHAEYSYSDYISEFERDIHLLGMEEEIEWRESDASKYAVAMYTAVLKAVNHSAQSDPVMRDITCIGYADSSPLSLSYVLDYLKTNSHHHFTEAQVRNSLRNVLFKLAGKQGHQTISSHQVVREAFRQVCKVSHRNNSCLNSTSCKLTSADERNHVALSDVFGRLTLSFEQQVNFTSVNLYNVANATVIESNGSFGSHCLDILTALCVFSTREHMQVADVMTSRFSGTFLRFFSRSLGYWPGMMKPVTNELRLNEVVTLTNLQASKELRYDLQTLLLIISLHSGAAKLQNEGVMTAINKTSMGVVRVLRAKQQRDTFLGGTNLLLLNILGVMYRGLGYPYKSKDLHELALEFHRKDHDQRSDSSSEKETALDEASTLHKLGIIYRYLGDLTSAQSAHERSLKLLQKSFGADSHAFISGSLLNLAVVYNRQGKFKEALQLHNRSLLIIKGTYGPRHANVGRLLNTIGTVYYRLGEFRQAIYHSEQGLEILEDFHGPYHPHVAEALNFLGFMYRDQGDLDQAQVYLERSVSIKEKVFDSNHFILGEALNDLGVVYTRTGQARKAQTVLKRALSIFKQTWGEGHTSVATVLNSLGEAYCVLGEPQGAIPLHTKALETLLDMGLDVNVEHYVAETRSLLGNAHWVMGNLEDAKMMYRLAYKGFRKLYDTDHWRVLGVLNSIKSVEFILNKTCETRACLFVVYLISFLSAVPWSYHW